MESLIVRSEDNKTALADFGGSPALARTMITRALDAGTPARWAAGDEVYGADPGLRRELEDRAIGYVLAIACSQHVTTTTTTGRQRADTLARRLPRRAWQRLSAGQGSKGPRYYDWAWIAIDAGAGPAGQRSLLIRRNNTTGELAYYRCYAPAPMSLATLVRLAGRRWTVDHPGHARHYRARPPAPARRHDPADQQRDPPPA